MIKSKWLKTTLLVLASALIIYLIGVCISVRFFDSTNPVRSAIGLAKILWTDSPYVQIQDTPVDKYLIKANDFEKHYGQFKNEVMESSGYVEIYSEQMGSQRSFKSENNSLTVTIRGNKHYMRCSVE